jgi:ATP-dependent helicase HepA
MTLNIGDLVESNEFAGIAKIISLNEIEQVATVAFFESPLRAEARPLALDIDALEFADIYDESVVYYHDVDTRDWCRARYQGLQPEIGHLIFFRSDDRRNVQIADLYVLNIKLEDSLSPNDFLSSRCNDTPYFSNWRLAFIQAYIEQRASCKSISSIPSSSVELEPHQLAVIRRVLLDDEKKYLLADEVGLGKTIEACVILREHILNDKNEAVVVVAVPETLISQWKQELKERFYLEDLFDEQIFICSHDTLYEVLKAHQITMLVIDEAHQIADWAWSDKNKKKFKFIAEVSNKCNSCLLLSGTPLTGNDKSFLAMLHLLSSDKYEINDRGIHKFEQRRLEREMIGGIYQALISSNDNSTLTDLLEKVEVMFPNDLQLLILTKEAKPFIDWMVEENSEEKTRCIRNLRKFIGENYRIHQRMLRNRREKPSIACLFPGLLGAEIYSWDIKEQFLSVDQYLDAYRSEFFINTNPNSPIASVGFLQWLTLALVSPILVSNLAEKIIQKHQVDLEENELEFLKGISLIAKEEQIAKDKVLQKVLSEWLVKHEKGKAIIFCGDTLVAENISKNLKIVFPEIVERFVSNEDIKFCSNQNIRILICDLLGEDGLNLHGGEKLIIHYGLPITFDRIEQRNGRVNRYSAAIVAKPIQSYVLVPSSNSLIRIWVDILNDTVRIFNDSVASLQYVLEEYFSKAWNQVYLEGTESLLKLKAQLEGSEGLIEKERKKVRVQEELNAMDEEVEEARLFADKLAEADEVADEQSDEMMKWILKGLHFLKKPGEITDTFRFVYNTDPKKGPHTQLGVTEFLKECITGIDMEKSDYSSPVTALMSPNRKIASHGQQVYPMRFGQPFIDTIHNSLHGDPRGICSASVRCVKGIGFKEPKAYFCFHWLLSASFNNSTHREQRIADENFTPKVIRHWLDHSSKLVVSELVLKVLNADYQKDAPQKLSNGLIYQDINLRSERWHLIEDYYPKNHWPSLVENMMTSSLNYMDLRLLELDDGSIVTKKLEAITVIFLIDMES